MSGGEGLLLAIVAFWAGVGFYWVLQRMVLRPAERPEPQRREPPRPCGWCGRLTQPREGRCEWCHADLHHPVVAELGDLIELQWRLQQIKARGGYSEETVNQLLKQVDAHRQRLLRQAGWAPTPPAREPAPQRPLQPSVPPRPEPLAAALVELLEEPGPRAAEGAVPPRVPPVKQPAPALAAAAATPAAVKPASVPRPAPEPRPAPVPTIHAAPPPPRKSWLDVLAEFLEERNIRWAELVGVLVGGLLIVGASIALVVSFWKQLEQIPLFQFFGLVAVSSAVFGLGLYALQRWKLPHTGRGLLVIGSLLVPLDFLALASLSKGGAGPLHLVASAAALAVLAYLLYLTARVLVPRGTWHMPLAAVGHSAALLAAAWLPGVGESAALFLAVGSAAVGVYAAAMIAYLLARRTDPEMDPPQADSLFILQGTAGFALAVVLGLLMSQRAKAEGLVAMLPWAAWLVAGAAVPVLLGGLHVVRRMKPGESAAVYRTAGTAVALSAGIGMFAAMAMAWPQPAAMLAVGLLEAAVLVFMAWWYRVPLVHAGAVACASVVYLTGYHLLMGHLPLAPDGELQSTLVRLFLNSESGTALVGWFVVLGAVAQWLGARSGHGKVYAGSAAAVAAASFLMVTVHTLVAGPSQAYLAAAVYAVYGAGSLVLAGRFRAKPAVYAGAALLVGSSLWALWWWQDRAAFASLWWPAALAVEALATALVAAGVRRTVRSPRAIEIAEAYRVPLTHVAEGVAGLAALLAGVTLWIDQAHTQWHPAPVVTAVCLSALWFLLAWGYRSPWRTWIASTVALLGLAHTLVLNYSEWPAVPWQPSLVLALLIHATAAGLASVGLRAAVKRLPSAAGEALADTFLTVLHRAALLSAAAVVPVLMAGPPGEPLAVAGWLVWLAAIGLALAWSDRAAWLFALGQAVLAASALFAAAAWLDAHPWSAKAAVDYLDSRSLQTFGVALAGLSLAWALARLALERLPTGRQLLDPPWPAVDRAVLYGVAAVQLLVAAGNVRPGVQTELGARWTPLPGAPPGGPEAWLLVGLVGLALVALLWSRWREAEVVSACLTAATIPCLAAEAWASQQAAGSALRWSQAIVFLAVAAVIWARRPALAACRGLGAHIAAGRYGAMLARGVLTFALVVPTVAVTIAAALLQIARVTPGGPAAGSLFANLGPTVSYLVPLVLVVAGLVGFALRERATGYAFSAGLVVLLAVVLGYLLDRTLRGLPFGPGPLAEVFQWAAVASSLWAMAWIAARRRVDVWRETPQPMIGAGPCRPGVARARDRASLYMTLQLAIGVACAAILLAPAMAAVFFRLAGPGGWTAAVGSWLGWAAMALVAASLASRRIGLHRPLRPTPTGMVGMAVMVLLASTVGSLTPQGPVWAYRTLMLGWAAYALAVAMATWWAASLIARRDGQGPPQALVRAATGWVIAAGLASTLLALKAAFLHGDRPWAAGAIAVASIAGATMAVWRRREEWAFAGGLGVNVAASLVVWHFRYHVPFDQWQMLLVQANVIASAAVALVWLSARRRLYELRDLTVGETPLLALQTSLGVLGNIALAGAAVIGLAAHPSALPGWALPLAEGPGWLALALAAAAAAWYLRQTSPSDLFHAIGGLTVAVTVLGAAAIAREIAPTQAPWAGYHALTAGLAGVGLLLLGLGWLGRHWQLGAGTGAFSLAGTVGWTSRSVPTHGFLGTDLEVHPTSNSGTDLEVHPTSNSGTDLEVHPTSNLGTDLEVHPTSNPGTDLEVHPMSNPEAMLPAAFSRALVFPAGAVQAWVTAVGAAALFFAVLHNQADPQRPWWSFASALAVVLAAGVVALWQRRPGYVAASGIALNAAATLLWAAWGPWHLAGLVWVNVVALAAGSSLWAALRYALGERVADFQSPDRSWRYSHVAAGAALGAVGLTAVFRLAPDAAAWGSPADDWLGWLALTSVAIALAVHLWDRSARLTLGALYLAALVEMVMWLDEVSATPQDLAWTATWALAGFVLAMAALGRLLPSLQPLWRRLRLAAAEVHWPANWFPPSQAGVGALAAALSLWVAVDPAVDSLGMSLPLAAPGRFFGPAAAAVLFGAALLMAAHRFSPGAWRPVWQHAALGLGPLVAAEVGWAWLDAGLAAPWLHSTVILMAAAIGGAAVVRLLVAPRLAAENDWAQPCRHALGALAAVAALSLAAVLVQEVIDYRAEGGTPMAWPAIAVVGLTLMSLAAGLIATALSSAWDPLQLTERGRTGYVYAAEMVAVLLGVHLRLTVPELFQLGLVRDYWMLLVLLAAFLGVGLSELFSRRGVPVLSRPLENTALLLPLAPAVAFWLPLEQRVTFGLAGATPALWLLGGLFYGLLAYTRRSLPLGVLAALAANVGLWIIWHRVGLGLWEHPQLWLIPPALAVLAAEHLNRKHLAPAQGAAVRYAALCVIYVSSTSEFVRELGSNWYLPLVLVGLSVAGIVASLVLRVRSFLLVGFAFLLVVIVGMIWDAAVQQHHVWVFYVSCIVLGAAIIALFLFIEMKRERMLAALARFRTWQR